MSGKDVPAADELEELRQLKAHYCCFLDTKDAESWRSVCTGGADPMTAPAVTGPEGVVNFVPMVMGGLENVATMHHCHTPELTLTSATTATGIWGTVHGGSRACT